MGNSVLSSTSQALSHLVLILATILGGGKHHHVPTLSSWEVAACSVPPHTMPFTDPLCPRLTLILWHQVSSLTFLCLHFLIYKFGVIIAPASRGAVKMKGANKDRCPADLANSQPFLSVPAIPAMLSYSLAGWSWFVASRPLILPPLLTPIPWGQASLP